MAPKTDVIEQLRARIVELEEEKRLLEDDCGYQMQWKREFREQLEYSQKQLAAEQLNNKLLRDAITAVNDLINDSSGVAGLHLNGDIATWEELRTGGRFEEWLCLFDEALSTPASTEALDAYVAEKVKETTATQKEYYEGVFQDGSKQIAKAFRQRDLVVKAIRHCIAAMGSVTDVKKAMDWPQLYNAQMLSLQALDAIKESDEKLLANVEQKIKEYN